MQHLQIVYILPDLLLSLASVYVCVYRYIHIHVYPHINKHTLNLYVYIPVYMYIHVYLYRYIYSLCVYIYISMYVYIYIYVWGCKSCQVYIGFLYGKIQSICSVACSDQIINILCTTLRWAFMSDSMNMN